MFDYYPGAVITLGVSVPRDPMFVDENKLRVVFKTIFSAVVCHKTINRKTLGVPANFSLRI